MKELGKVAMLVETFLTSLSRFAGVQLVGSKTGWKKIQVPTFLLNSTKQCYNSLQFPAEISLQFAKERGR